MDIDANNSIDDFEMKPLTAGLGFHKKSVSLKEHLSKTGIAEQAVRRAVGSSALPSAPPSELIETPRSRSSREIIDELHNALRTKSQAPKAAQLSAILPREIGDVTPVRPAIPEPQPLRSPDPLSRVKFQIPEKSIADSAGVRRGAHDNMVKPLSPVAVSIPALILDALVVLAFSLIFLVSLIVVTNIKLPAVIESTRGEFATQLSLFVLYLAVFEIYAIVSRSFFNATVGEWTFDLQLGSEAQVRKPHYPVLVLWRSIMNLMTGLILLPFFSLVFNRDLAARLSGLQLYRKN